MGQEFLSDTALAFDTLCAALDERRWFYEKDKEHYTLTVKAGGQDLFMSLDITCDPDKRIVSVISHLPFTVAEERRVAMAEALCYVNASLSEGSFDYHYRNGALCFRLSSSYRGSRLSVAAFDRMITVSFATVDRFNDMLLLFSLGTLTLGDVVKKIGA